MSYRRGGLAPRVPREALRPSGVFLGLLGLCAAAGLLLWYGYGFVTLNVIVFIVAGWLVTLSLHEYAHALLGYRAGDVSVLSKGYLTLNPVKYAHPILSIVLPVLVLLLGGIGLPGGAVWIDRSVIRDRVTDSLISLAGPAVNVGFTLVLTMPFLVGIDVLEHRDFWSAVAFLAFLQLTASLLNLLPIPGLDGGNALRPWLAPKWGRVFDVVAPFGMLILLVLIFEPQVRAIFFFTVALVADVIGLPLGLAGLALSHVQFWT